MTNSVGFWRREPVTVEKRREREILIRGGDGVLVVMAIVRERKRDGERETDVEKEK